MKLLRWSPRAGGEEHVAILFGLGLVGGAIEQSLCIATSAESTFLPFDWDDATARPAQFVAVELAALAPRHGHAAFGPTTVSVVWAGGVSGFASPSDVMVRETRLMEDVLTFAELLAARSFVTRVSFHLISSAGGLFEGRTHCKSDAHPNPLRAYGEAKLTQEAMLRRATGLTAKRIYRPSSVYGYAPRGRWGLITALIANALANRTTRIVGTPNTIRDYVLASDIGRFIARQITSAAGPDEQTLLLANGRPTSIFEVVQNVEQSLSRRLLLQYDPRPNNALNMSFLPSALPKGWVPTSVSVGVRLVTDQVRRHRLLKV